jgi:signal transduction histidine kinase
VVQLTTGGNELVIEDSGPGIPEEERQKVFERFYRLSESRASGSGLGLSIVQRIVELHDGHIAIEDAADGSGTRVRVRFPVTPAS